MPGIDPLLHSVYSRANCLHPQAFFVRIDARCNQKCDFCNILGPGVDFRLSGKYVRAMIRQIARLRSNATVNFTGGEPTLRKDLPDLIRYAKAAGIERVVLQTNAIRLATPQVLDSLLDAGLDDALVSFHSHRAEVSDALTGAPGTWAKTVQGIESSLARGLPITLNTVLTTRNADHLTETIDYALERFAGLEGFILSPLQPHGSLLDHPELMPTYASITEPVRRAARRILEAGSQLYLSYCENPLCWLLEVFEVEPTAEVRRHISRRLRVNGCDGCHLSTMMDKDKSKPAGCESCAFDSVCYGVWDKYVDLYGSEELRPVPPGPGMGVMRRQFSVAAHEVPTSGTPPVRVALSSVKLARRSAAEPDAAVTG